VQKALLGRLEVTVSGIWSRDPLDGPVILFDAIVQTSILAHQDVDAGISFDASNGGRVGTALVDGDLLPHIVQADGALQKVTRHGQISPGSEEEAHPSGQNNQPPGSATGFVAAGRPSGVEFAPQNIRDETGGSTG
jgi:hypothetical protein